MILDAIATEDSRILVDMFPLGPILDEFAYEMAIAILDDLFEKGERRTRAELEYFRALAGFAARYEEAVGLA